MPTPQDREAARRAQRPVQAALVLLIVVVVALVAAGGLAAYRIYTKANQRFIGQAGPFFAVTEDLSVEMLNEETGVRGFVITGDPSTLAPYRQGKKYVRLELAVIAKDQKFDAHIPPHLRAMRREVASLEAFFAKQIALVRTGPAGRRRAEQQTLVGKSHFDHLRAAEGALIGDAQAVITRSHHEQRRTLISWFALLGAAGLLAIAIATGLLLRVPRRLYRLFREERMARREAEQAGDAARALAHVRDAVVLLDEAGLLRYWNSTAGELFEFKPGDSRSDLFDGAVEGLTESDATGRLIRLRNEQRWLTMAESRFEGGQVFVFRDVTEEQRLERLRADFVATAAHELRTPLAAVYGAVRTLRHQEHALSAEMNATFLEMIEVEAERLKLITDQLLVTAQLDSADLKFQRQTVDAGELCKSVLDTATSTMPEGIDIELSLPKQSVLLDADPDRLRQVVSNLLENAIKYSPAGGRIDVSVEANHDAGSIAVQDRGLGIPLGEQERIFDKFYRLDPAMTRGIGGSGLGLYISRQLIEQMKGTLTVGSENGTGSTFTITLPLAT